MGLVLASLETMGMAQILLASVLLGSYALALGDFAGARGGLIAIVIAIFAAVGFVVLSDPWEAGVILLALAPSAWACLPAPRGHCARCRAGLLDLSLWSRRRSSCPFVAEPHQSHCSSA